MQAGVEWADSYTTDAHKWLLTGFDATLFWVADRAALTGALAILPEYLRNAATDAGAVVDYRDWQIELGRRFRALKLWFVLRWYGAEGLRAHVRSGVALAQERFQLHLSSCWDVHGEAKDGRRVDRRGEGGGQKQRFDSASNRPANALTWHRRAPTAYGS